MLFCAVFLVSFSSLAYEVLLTRAFSISQWHHLSFMVISIALFGFAASGTALNILDFFTTAWEKHLTAGRPIKGIIILFTSSAVAAFVSVNRLPLDYYRLPLETVQALYLLAAYLLFAVPFFFAGTVIALAYAAVPEKTGEIYLATMGGSAAGATAPALLLPFTGEGRLILLIALLPMLMLAWPAPAARVGPAACASGRSGVCPGKWKTILAGGAITALAVIFMTVPERWVDPRMSPYKSASQVLRFPETVNLGTETGIRGRVDRVSGPAIRFAPGVSLKSRETLPRQEVLYTDGDSGLFLYHLRTESDHRFARFSLAFSGYIAASAPQSALLILGGGGSSIPTAMAAAVPRIRIVISHPDIARAVRSHYGLPVAADHPRAFLARSDDWFDLIHVENRESSLIGAGALSQQYMLTVNAFAAYIDHLTPGGILIITGKLLLPPSNTLRLWATAYEGLRKSGFRFPHRHLAMIRNWDLFALIVSKRRLDDLTNLKKWIRRLNFDAVYLPEGTAGTTNRFNRFDRAYYADGILSLSKAYAAGEEKTYSRSYPLDVAPQTDDRPFPEKFLKWSRITSLYESVGSRIYAMLLSGEIVVAMVFVEAVAVSLLLLAPLLAVAGKQRRAKPRNILYFLSVGCGFMFLELYFVHSYGMLFGDPVITLSVVLSAMLVFSGMGGYLSRNFGPERIRHCLMGLTLLQAVFFLGFEPLGAMILKWSALARTAGSVLLLAPIGIMAGIPFAVGMRTLPTGPMERACAWSANGCASVLAAVASAQIAVSIGISSLLVFAAAGYFTALVCIRKRPCKIS